MAHFNSNTFLTELWLRFHLKFNATTNGSDWNTADKSMSPKFSLQMQLTWLLPMIEFLLILNKQHMNSFNPKHDK